MSYPTHTGWEARIEGHVRDLNGQLRWIRLTGADGKATREEAIDVALDRFWRQNRSPMQSLDGKVTYREWDKLDTRLMVRFIPEPPEWEWDKAASRKVGKSEWAEDTE